MYYLYNYKSAFQTIQVERDTFQEDEHTLWLDGAFQYESAMEYRYHETMVTMGACCAESLHKVLICGGGDGMAAREVQRFKGVFTDLVEIDPEMIRLYSTDKRLTGLNSHSLMNPDIRVHTMDALRYARECGEKYDLILLDFPSPNEENEFHGKNYNNLYSPGSVNLFLELLQPWGILTAQSGIQASYMVPFLRNLLNRGFYVWNYEATYTKKGSSDNFTSACRRQLRPVRPIPERCRLVTPAHLKVVFSRATEVDEERLDYYRLFESVEGAEFESI